MARSDYLPIDHMVSPAEAWDSDAATGTISLREAYTNDLGDSRPWRSCCRRCCWKPYRQARFPSLLVPVGA